MPEVELLAGHPAAVTSEPAAPARPASRAERPCPRLEIPPYDLGAALALERELGVSRAFAQILVRRGLADAERARRFLEPCEQHPPEAFAGMADAVALVRRHLEQESPIVVHGDYDVDGVCATALVLRCLRRLGGRVEPFLPSRTEDGYGLSLRTVERLTARGAALLITVDCGITAVDEVAAARAGGLDVVVTDHHSPRVDGRLPDAPIVHPSLGGYPCPDLCGTAVAFKLAQALGAPGLADEIELVALATVADLMPLRDENRRLVRDGLAALANTARPGLRALMSVAGADPSDLSAGTVAFRLAPRINASGRVRRADAALELLMTEDELRAGEIAAELDALNAERRDIEQRILWEADAQVQELGARSAYVLAAEGWHPGVIGIVASRIVERYHRPAVLIALDGAGMGQGSARSVPGFDLLAGLNACARHLIRHGGHRAAAGLTLQAGELDALRGSLEAYADEWLGDDLRQPVERIDAIVSGASLGLAFAEELRALEPCGMGNPGPKLLVPGARFGDLRPMGDGRHARFSVSSGGASARAVAFGCDGDPGAEPGEAVDASFRLERNVWNGAVEARLVLRGVHRSPRPAIEVVGEPPSYLGGVLAELDAPALGSAAPGEGQALVGRREVLDRRGEGSLSVLADARAAGGPVLAVCADVPRRLRGLTMVAGGFALACHHALERDPGLVEAFAHVVVLDPPATPAGAEALSRGDGYCHLAWTDAELGFARKMHDLEYALRAPLASLYRALSAAAGPRCEGVEEVLKGDAPRPRPERLAARLVRVLSELGLVSLEPEARALTLLSGDRTELERSPSYRAYTQRHAHGLAFLDAGAVPASWSGSARLVPMSRS